MKIGIIGAMSVEVEALKERLDGATVKTVSGIEFYSGTLCGKQVVVAKCGIGKVFAAICAQTMIVCFGVTHIINTGVGGALSDNISTLDVAIADGVVQHDMDTSPIGDPVGLISGINKIVLPTSKAMRDAAMTAASELGVKYESGIIASGDQFIASLERKQFIREQFSAISCEMEGAAIGHVCYVSGVECLIIRCISDSASGEATMEYPEMVKHAAVISQKMTEKIITII